MIIAHDAFDQASQDGDVEVCITGTASEELDTHEQLYGQFLNDLRDFTAGKLPHATHQQALAADKQLNQAYLELIRPLEKRSSEGDTFCLKPTGAIRDAERKWLAYRDAWIRFARLRWPQTSSDDWLAFLTEERTQHLGELKSLFAP